MSLQSTETQLGEAILRSITAGEFPVSDVVSKKLSSNVLHHLSDAVEKVKCEFKTEIRALGHEAAPDVDGWIVQAERLRADIARSLETAQDIVQGAEAKRTLIARIEDADNKTRLLREELMFNNQLGITVQEVALVCRQIEEFNVENSNQEVERAYQSLRNAQVALSHLNQLEHSQIVNVLRRSCTQAEDTLKRSVVCLWNSMVTVDTPRRCIIIEHELGGSPSVTLPVAGQVLSDLQLLEDVVSHFSIAFDSLILAPRFKLQGRNGSTRLFFEQRTVWCLDSETDGGFDSALLDARSLIEFLGSCLPQIVALPLSAKLLPLLHGYLVTFWITPRVPRDPDGLFEFEATLSRYRQLTTCAQALALTGSKEMCDWISGSPQLWSVIQKHNNLAAIRTTCFEAIKVKESVEKVETQLIASDDVLIKGGVAEAQHDEDWEAEWPEDISATPASPQKAEPDDEEDVSAWGLDEAEPEPAEITDAKADITDDDDVADAWGWGDEETESAQTQVPEGLTGRLNKDSHQSQARGQEITLREVYTVTGTPDALLDIIIRGLVNSQALRQPQFADSHFASIASELDALPSLALAMYRAIAPANYSDDPAGNMLIYNDCMRLSEQLKSLVKHSSITYKGKVVPLSPAAGRSILEEVTCLEEFGKRAYKREMESQRTILRDLLDGAQGFVNCTTSPFADESDIAVATTADRIREVARLWKNVLSHSVWLQSLGSLLSTIIGKIIVEIEDLSDISEQESRKLRQYCDQVASLAELFTIKDSSGGSRDSTGVYTPNWFRFQYLSEILESSLADIKYMWTESELRLEMQAEEVIELIRALFADSDHRRRAINEIRRSRSQSNS